MPSDPTFATGPANTWVQGGDLNPAWKVRTAPGPGRFVLVWQRTMTEQNQQGAVCGVSMGTLTDIDIEHHRIRTQHDREGLPLSDAEAFASLQSYDETSSCAGKIHVTSTDGDSWRWRDETWSGEAFEIDDEGAVHLPGGLVIAPGESASKSIDTTRQVGDDSIRTTGTSTLLNLGFYDRADVAYEQALCDSQYQGLNCLGPGSGP